MKCVRINITKLEMTRFSLKDGVDLSIFFDDGGKKCLQYSSKLDNVLDDVKQIITKIQVYEKAQNRVLDGDVLDSFVSVVIEDDEEVMERIKNFLSRIKDDRSKMSGYGTHQGYIENLNRMQKKVLEIKKGAEKSPVRNEFR
jgi:hypothetical protein